MPIKKKKKTKVKKRVSKKVAKKTKVKKKVSKKILKKTKVIPASGLVIRTKDE